MNRREFTSVLWSARFAAAAERKRPNIVFILVDDLGWGEPGCYGNTFNRTPNIDRLASEGIRFTNAYSAAPVCSPTRTSIMVGQHPARVGITDFLRADDPNYLRPGPASLANVLKSAGYRTGLIGKWHLMGDYKARRGDPKLHGFDEVICSETSYIGPGYYWHPYQHLAGLPARRPGEYLTDRLNQEAVEFIARNAGTRPFFLYLSHYAVHTKLDSKPEVLAKYTAKPGAGKKKNNPALAAMLETVDEGVGLILEELAKRGLDRETIVIFNSDNGGETNVTTNAHLHGGKSMLFEGGLRVPLAVRWPGQIPAGTVSDDPVVSTDYYPTLLELAGVRPPNGHIQDGVSLAGVLRKPKSHLGRRDIFWYYPLPADHFLGGKSAMAIRNGRWKLIEFLDTGHRELYDLAADPSELRDLATAKPELVKKMAARLAAWRAATVKDPS